MPVEPWPAYIPEVNAGRYEGVGPSTWISSGGMWMTMQSICAEAIGLMTANLAALNANWHGTAPLALTASTTAFLAWLAEMEANATSNAMACYAVATAYSAGQGSMIPLPDVNTNRISEAIAEATNFLGINSGLIAFLNAQYAEFWAQNAGTMISYDSAVTTATMPKPVNPPPPLASAAGAGAALGDAAAESAINGSSSAALQGASQSFTDSVGGVTDAGSQAGTAASAPDSAMSSMMSSVMGPLSQIGGQAGGLTQAMNPSAASQLMSPFTSLFNGMGGQTSAPETLGLTGPASSAFTGFGAGGGAAATGTGAGGFGGGTLGGGLGGSLMSQTDYMGASSGPVKSQSVFSGVTNRPLALTSAVGTGGAGGGGMMPVGAGATGASSSSSRGKQIVLVADTTDADVTAEARALLR